MKFIESRMMAQGLGEGENEELFFNGYKVQFCNMKRFLDMMVKTVAQQYKST